MSMCLARRCRPVRWIAAGLVLALVCGVRAEDLPLASNPPTGSVEAPSVRAPSRRDPFETVNRAIFSFNDRIDSFAVKPLAEGYKRVVPELARTGVDNFFGNVGDVWSAVNQLLQGKVVQAARMGLRVATNTVFGLGGLLDPATEFGLERHSEDLGQTLGAWGLPPGPYLVLPIFGPSDLRDAVALPADRYATSTSAFVNLDTSANLSLTTLDLVSTRAGLLSAGRLLDEVAMDKYSFLRDAYLARRRNQVFDGNPPDEPDDPADNPDAENPR